MSISNYESMNTAKATNSSTKDSPGTALAANWYLNSQNIMLTNVSLRNSLRDSQCAYMVVWNALDRNKKAVSENATRNVITWLRSDGCAPHEKEMFKHEWFNLSDSEEEEGSSEVTSTVSFIHRPRVMKWLLKTSRMT
ncbi:hypothetical protein J1614_002876 [Plenodomus biglobosus]|nr:hypothetical protein J1614_002876 [Plenodomus biglobosus]